MKILCALTSYEIGGVSTVARNVMDVLERDGAEIILLAERLSERHYPLQNSVKVINLAISPRRNFFPKSYNIIQHIVRMRRCIMSLRPDVILTYGSQINCYLLASLLFIRFRRPKIIISEHSEEMFLKAKSNNVRYLMSKIAYRCLMFALYRRADYIVAVSDGIAKLIMKYIPTDPDKIKIVHNPIDIKKVRMASRQSVPIFDAHDHAPIIGTLTRLSSEKGIAFLIQGFRHLLYKRDVRLLIVGDGLERQSLERMVQDAGMEKYVIFTGWVDNPYPYLARMDVCVLPSLWEGFPNIILEAMACKVPVIASDVSEGIREVIKNGINGILIQSGSPISISEAVYEVLSDDSKREKMIEEAYKTVQMFDIQKIQEEYKKLIYA